MDKNSEIPGSSGTPDSNKVISPQERLSADLISRAMESGRSSIWTWSGRTNTIGGTGMTRIAEESDPDKTGSVRLNPGTLELVFPPENVRSRSGLEELGDRLVGMGIFEVVRIAPLTTDIVETRSAPYKSFFRTKFREEKFVVGQRPLTMQETTGGSNEAAAVLNYYAGSTSLSRNVIRELQYLDGYGRDVNDLELKLVIPLKLAEEIFAALQDDPTLIRKLTETFIRTKYPKFFIEDAWNRFGKPPYDKWDSSEQGSRLYLVDLIKEPDFKPEPPSKDILKKTIPISTGRLPN